MKKHHYKFCFLISLAINILFIINLLHVGRERHSHHQEINHPLTWSQKAAEEAEAVAAIACSGHGRAFLDGPILDGQPVCECYGCYGGTDCSELPPGCAADADSGTPIFLEPFWMQNAADSAVVVSGWHRMGYEYADNTFMSTELESYIRKLHSIVGNAVTEGRYMVFGIGSSQLLSAAVFALSSENSSSPSNVVASIPYYPMYKAQTVFFSSENFQFEGDTNSWKSHNSTNDIDVVEFVTSPNNPDGELRKSILGRKTIYDHAYLWPHFTPITGPSDHDVMLFTLSKLTGHGGTRLGWAIIKDKDVYEKFLNYIRMAEMGTPRETQLRALKLLKVVTKEDGKPFFKFSYNKMRERWDRLTSVFSKSTRFSIQKIHPLHCNFFNVTRLSSPAYAWVKCEREEDDDCGAVLEANKIIGRSGSAFSVRDRYTRLSLIKSQDDFELLFQRLTELVLIENGSIKTI